MRWREIEWSHTERGFHLEHKSIVSFFSKLFIVSRNFANCEKLPI
jgi:hypothetical protein